MKNLRFWILSAGLVVVLYVVLPWPGGKDGNRQNAAGDDSQITYLCTETREVVVGLRQQTPMLNPDTGRHTLVRALYCSECSDWWPAPDPRAYPGNPLSADCRRHGIPMSPVRPEGRGRSAGDPQSGK